MKTKVNNSKEIKADKRIVRFVRNYDGYGRHLVECIDGLKFENERTIEIGSIKEICYSINNYLGVV